MRTAVTILIATLLSLAAPAQTAEEIIAKMTEGKAAEVGVVLLQQHWTALLYPSQVPAFQRFSDNYSTPFFHGLLPLYDWPRYLCNAIWLIALAWNASAFSYQHRRGRLPGGGILVLILGLLFFVMGETTSGMVVSILFTFVMVMVTLWSFFSLREEEAGDA